MVDGGVPIAGMKAMKADVFVCGTQITTHGICMSHQPHTKIAYIRKVRINLMSIISEIIVIIILVVYV